MEPGFFIKLTEIPDLASKLEDPEFNERLRTDPASVFAEHGIDVPPELIPDTVELPSAERIVEIKEALAVLGDNRADFPWFPWIFQPSDDAFLPWFMLPWFPFLFGSGESSAE